MTNISAPSKDQPLRASWASAVTGAVNALGAAGMPGGLVRDGAGGQGFAPLPQNKRDKSASSAVAADLGCWKISTVQDGDDVRPALVNKYFAIGGTVCEYEGDAFLDDFVPQGELEPGEEYTAADLPFVALVVDLSPSNYGDASVEGYATFAEMQSAAEEPTQIVRPLYKLTHTGGVAIDFRNMPLIAAGEVES